MHEIFSQIFVYCLRKFHNESGIEYEMSTNDIVVKIEDEKTTNDSAPKANSGISNMLCGVLCKSRVDEVLNDHGKQTNDDSKNSTSQGISFTRIHIIYEFSFTTVKKHCCIFFK